MLDFINTASKNFFIDIVNNLKKTKLIPSHPNNTEIESKLDPRSCCEKSCIKIHILLIHFNLYFYIFSLFNINPYKFKVIILNLNNRFEEFTS